MTFQLRCHFYWYSCCMEGREGACSLSTLCLDLFFKWPSNPAAVWLPFLASLFPWQQWGVGWQWLSSKCLSAYLSDEERESVNKGRKERHEWEREWGALIDIPSSLSKLLLSFSPYFDSGFAVESAIVAVSSRIYCGFVCDWFPSPIFNTSATQTQPLHQPPAHAVNHSRPADWQSPLFTLLGCCNRNVCQSQNIVPAPTWTIEFQRASPMEWRASQKWKQIA